MLNRHPTPNTDLFARIEQQPAAYYDINYQTPTSLGAGGVRESNLGSVAYSTMSDGRFARTDNNSSPVSNVSHVPIRDGVQMSNGPSRFPCSAGS